MFASGGPLLAIPPFLLLSPVALNTFIAHWLSLVLIMIIPACACVALWPPGLHLWDPLLFWWILAWILASEVRTSADYYYLVLACMDLILLVHNIVAQIPYSTTSLPLNSPNPCFYRPWILLVHSYPPSVAPWFTLWVPLDSAGCRHYRPSSAKIILCVLSVLCVRRSWRSRL